MHHPRLPPFTLSRPCERFVPITNPEMLEKIERAVSLVCNNCNTNHTCSMLQNRRNAQGRSLLECSVVKRAGVQ
jgi:invasion protein IalB